jgi:ABC-type transporter MlaC component
VNRPLALLSCALLSLALLGRPAAARAEGATAAVKAANDRLRSAVDDFVKAKGDRTAAKDKVRAAVDSLLDFSALAQAAAGDHWAEMKPEQQKRFSEALRGVIEAKYMSSSKGSEGESDLAKVKNDYLGEEQNGEGKTVVKTKLTSGEDTAQVDYVLEPSKARKGGWRAIDVVTEGVSLAETYQEMIGKLWPKKGADGVISTLDKKRKQLESAAPATASQ